MSTLTADLAACGGRLYGEHWLASFALLAPTAG